MPCSGSDGKSVLFERDSLGQISAVIDPAGQRLAYTRDTQGDLQLAEDQLHAITRYTYNDHHGLVEIIDPLERKLLKNLYDEQGRLIAQEDGDGNRTAFNHDIAGRLSVVTDRNGHSTTFYYDERGNITTRIDALDQHWTDT